MLQHRSLSTAAALVCGFVVASGQQWNQPWFLTNDKYGPGTFESRVWDTFPLHTQSTAVIDDFVATGISIKRIRWWGRLSSIYQAPKPFLVAFYKNNPNGECAPILTSFIYQPITATQTIVGVDCKGYRIRLFTASLPFWFVGAKGERYWIQISEIDNQSFHPGSPDFWWAFHHRTPNYPNSWNSCKALYFDAALALKIVVDQCDTTNVDMAFQLWG